MCVSVIYGKKDDKNKLSHVKFPERDDRIGFNLKF